MYDSITVRTDKFIKWANTCEKFFGIDKFKIVDVTRYPEFGEMVVIIWMDHTEMGIKQCKQVLKK